MQIIYLDNFRGFEDTYIPLKDINFLVGENSTGKTSILSLINLLNNSLFWIKPDFNTEEFTFGSFDEISGKSNNKSHFEIGLFYIIDEKKFMLMHLKFYSKKGIPTISEFSYSTNNFNVTTIVIIDEMSVKYKIVNKNKNITISDDYLGFFKNWIMNIHSKKKEDFKVIEVDSENINSIFFLKIEVESNLTKRKRGKTLDDIFPTLENVTWIAPIRAKPLRTYDTYVTRFSPEGTHAPYLLKEMLESKKPKIKAKTQEILEKFGCESGLFEKIDVKSYGDAEQSPFELNIFLNNKPFKISNVGYGVSQVLPILVEFLTSIYPNTKYTLAIQQPEIHLHPRAQAALGELIYMIHLKNNIKFIIETHSDYLLNRFRLNLHKNNHNKNISSQVLFFERTDNGNIVHVIEIEDTGKYSDDKPASFTDFFINEEINLLEI